MKRKIETTMPCPPDYRRNRKEEFLTAVMAICITMAFAIAMVVLS